MDYKCLYYIWLFGEEIAEDIYIIEDYYNTHINDISQWTWINEEIFSTTAKEIEEYYLPIISSLVKKLTENNLMERFLSLECVYKFNVIITIYNDEFNKNIKLFDGYNHNEFMCDREFLNKYKEVEEKKIDCLPPYETSYEEAPW